MRGCAKDSRPGGFLGQVTHAAKLTSQKELCSAPLTYIVSRHANCHLCHLARRLALQPDPTRIARLVRQIDSRDRLANDAPNRARDRRRIVLANGISEFGILAETLRRLVESELGVRDLERDFVQDPEEQVGRLRVQRDSSRRA